MVSESVLVLHAQALKQNYTFPRYVWMAYDWFPPRWWTLERSQVEVNCTDSELAEFIERSLSFQWRPFPDDVNATTDSRKVRLWYMTGDHA